MNGQRRNFRYNDYWINYPDVDLSTCRDSGVYAYVPDLGWTHFKVQIDGHGVWYINHRDGATKVERRPPDAVIAPIDGAGGDLFRRQDTLSDTEARDRYPGA